MIIAFLILLVYICWMAVALFASPFVGAVAVAHKASEDNVGGFLALLFLIIIFSIGLIYLCINS